MAEKALQVLWSERCPTNSAPKTRPATRSGDIDDAIDDLMEEADNDNLEVDELARWRRDEPAWMFEQHKGRVTPVQYWIQLLPKYPSLASLAIDMLTIPASSCACERMFSELGDLLEPKRCKISANLMAALQFL